MRHRIQHGTLATAVVLLAVLISSSTARAESAIGEPGSGAGQYEGPLGVAVDTATGRLYITDDENHRVDVFDSSGAFLFAFGWNVNASAPEEKLQSCTTASGCKKGTVGAGAGQFGEFGRGGIAVDNSPASPGFHDVYVTETNHRLQKFDPEGHFVWMAGGGVDKTSHANLCTAASGHICGSGDVGGAEGQFLETLGGGLPVAIDQEGNLYVADPIHVSGVSFNTRIQKFEPSGAYVGPQLVLTESVGRVQALAVDSGGFYVAAENGRVARVDFSGNPVLSWGENGSVPSGSVTALAMDSIGDLFTAKLVERVAVINKYDLNGTKIKVLFPSVRQNIFLIGGLAFYHDATGDLFLSEQRGGGIGADPSSVLRVALPEPGPLLVPGSGQASPIGNIRATLKITFNPEGKASKAHFQYITKAQFLADGESFGTGTQTTPDGTPTPADFENHTAEATNVCSIPTEATCLKPETTYYFRAIVSNPDGVVEGEKAEFTTRPPLEVMATWATSVGTDAAALHAEVNPLSVHTSGHFQYIADGSDYQAHGFEHAEESGLVDFGSGEASVVRAAQLTGLRAGTLYHYRLVASDPFFPEVSSAPQDFTTFTASGAAEIECPNQAFRTGPSAALPDCRAYELVTPLDKSNGDVLTRVSNTGYPTNLDQSSAEGSAFTYSSYRAFADPESAPYTNQYLAVRNERGHAEEGWQSKALDPLRGPQFRTEFENEYKAFSSDLESAWLLQEGEPTLDPCAPAGFADLYRRTSADGAYAALSCAHPSLQFEELEHVNPAQAYVPELQGASADGTHAVFRIDDALPASPLASVASVAGRPVYQVYESVGGGTLRLVSVLPNGEAGAIDSSAGTNSPLTTGEQLANHNRFHSLLYAVSTDATRVFWSTGYAGSGPIYLRLNADQAPSKIEAGQCTQPVKACTIPVSGTVTPGGARFQVGNPQGTGALFSVDSGPLAGNLYRFDAEAEPPASQLIGKMLPNSNILGASNDLSRVYYASAEASTSEQAEGAVPGKLNVYLYDEGATRFLATLSSGGGETDASNQYGTPTESTPINRTARVSPDGESLVFMSNSTALAEETAAYDNTDVSSGQPDAEVYHYDANVNGGAGELRCVSCNPSGSRPAGSELAQATNGGIGFWAAAAVPLFETQFYQPHYLSDDGKRVFFDSFDALVLGDTNGKEDAYEWEAAGSGGCDAESSSYVVSSAGCLRLLSSGQSPFDSEFLDASASGSDAFFTTAESLLPQDYGLVDAYDARVDGGFPPPPNATHSCEGEACQGPFEAPNDPTPTSAAFAGAGNVKEKTISRRCPKGRVRRKGHCVVKKHRKRASHAQHRTASNSRGVAR